MDQLISEAIEKDVIIVGESSHGAHEFAYFKFELAKELLPYISFIAVEWDWSDIYEINRYVTYETDDYNLLMSRFPEFLWDNEETESFIDYLREWNKNKKNPVGFYGLDIFGLNNCLETLGFQTDYCGNDQHLSEVCKAYSKKLKLKDSQDINMYVCSQIVSILSRSPKDIWNTREMHMYDVFQKLRALHKGKSLILCHNSHAQSTECIKQNVRSLASMIKSKYVIGMLCYKGNILTSDKWNGKIISRKIREPDVDSYEYIIFKDTDKKAFILYKNEIKKLKARKYRALGAIVGNDNHYYFEGDLSCSFDAMICIRDITEIHY